MWLVEQFLRNHGWKLVVLAGLALLFGQTVLFGGVAPATGLLFAALLSLWAAAIVAISPTPPGLLARPSLVVASVAALLLTAWIVITLAPAAPGWAAPVWDGAADAPITYDRSKTIIELVKLGALAALFVAALTLGRDRKRARFTLRVLAGLAAAYAMWCVATFWLEPHLLLGEEKLYHQDRLTGTFLSANTAASLFGGFAALFLTLAAEEGVNQLKRKPEFGAPSQGGPTPSLVLFAWTGLVCLGALWLTGSRFGMGAVAVGLAGSALLMAMLAGLKARWASLIAGAALTLAIAAPILSDAGAARRAWFLEETMADRIGAMQTLAQIAAERPWQGHGLGAFREAVRPHLDAENLPFLRDFGAAHNIGLQWMLEGGLIGAALAGVVLAALLAALWPWPLKRSRPGRGRLVAGLSFTLIVLLHNLVDYSLQVPAVAGFLAVVLGLAVGATLKGEDQGETA